MPCPANTLPGRRKAPGGRERPPYNIMANGRQARQVDGSRGVSPLCVGADACIGPPAGLAEGWRLSVAAHSRPQCRAGVFARRLGFAASQGFRDDASIVPYGCGRQGPARLCRIFPPPPGNAPLCLRLAAHLPSGLRCPHRTARAEARLCSATAAPAPSRCIRRSCRGGFWGNCCPEGAPSRWTFREAARSKLSPAREFWGNCSPPRGHRRAVILASPG